MMMLMLELKKLEQMAEIDGKLSAAYQKLQAAQDEVARLLSERAMHQGLYRGPSRCEGCNWRWPWP